MTTIRGPMSAPDILAAGRRIANSRINTVLENIANAASTAGASGGDPYRRKIAVADPINPINDQPPAVRVVQDTSPFRTRYDPGNVLADRNGNVALPNVNMAVETADLRTATRAYEASLSAAAAFDRLEAATIDLIIKV